ncbi:hypothetical protein L7F22_061532 [Adiantum nelumboides]|nr:hypothetical protein [Adiantum nelumboides]
MALNPSPDLNDWTTKDLQAQSELMLHLGDRQVQMVRCCETSAEIWAFLRSIYHHEDLITRITVLKKLLSAILLEQQNTQKFVDEWRTLLDNALLSGLQLDESLQSMLLLAALPSSWRPFITTQASVVGLTVETLIARILQEDTMRSGSSSTITSAAVPHTAQYLQRAPGNFRWRPFRRSSGATRNLPRTNTPPTTVCGYCRQHGHVERDCRTKRLDQQRNDRRPQSNLHHVADHAHGQYGIYSLQLFHSILNSMHVQFNDASEWLLDTSATHHMTPHQHLLRGYESFPASVQVFLGDNRSLNAVGLGYMPVILPSGTTVKVRDVYYVPSLSRNILSVTAATLTGSSIEFFHDYCVVHFKLPSGHFETIKIQQKNRLYPIAISQQGPHYLIASTSTLSLNLTKATSTLLWHYRLGHINSKTLHQMRQKHLCHGLPDSLSPIDLCEGCLLGKASHKPFPWSQTRSTQLNQLVHSDLCGPMETPSLTGSPYFLTFVDDFCRYTTVYFLKLKSLVLVCFQDYCKQALRAHDIPIQVLR